MSARTLSPKGAWVFGTFAAMLGFGIMFLMSPSEGTPAWVVACAGWAFLLAGASIIVGYGEGGGVRPDGALAPETPWWLRLTHTLLGIGVGVCMAAVASWVAFGSGPRTFTVTTSFGGSRSAGAGGRIAFGIGAVLLYILLIVLIVTSIRRFRAAKK